MTTPPPLLAVLILCVPPPFEVVERPIKFASLTPAQARSLEGKLRLFKVVLDSMGVEHDGRVVHAIRSGKTLRHLQTPLSHRRRGLPV
jgi:hypothetical protein